LIGGKEKMLAGDAGLLKVKKDEKRHGGSQSRSNGRQAWRGGSQHTLKGVQGSGKKNPLKGRQAARLKIRTMGGGEKYRSDPRGGNLLGY